VCREKVCKEKASSGSCVQGTSLQGTNVPKPSIWEVRVSEIQSAGNKRIPQPEMGDKGRCQSNISFWQASLGKEVQDLKNNSRTKYARNKRAGNNRTLIQPEMGDTGMRALGSGRPHRERGTVHFHQDQFYLLAYGTNKKK
jgi:hypothetical protein